MAFIKWTDEMSVNVAEIDRQHQRLVAMLNEMDDAMRQGKGRDVLGKILNGMIEYTAEHFTTEEKYFSQYMYPDAENHIREHRTFVEKAKEFQKKFETTRIGLTTDIINFLHEWLKRHIMGSDKKYGPFFNERGLR